LDAAMDLLAAGTVDPRDLITDTFPLDSGISALARAAHPDHVKVLLRP
jgi:threonine dehydrogenase-like Zn-dependent dehydrogenase